MSAKDLMLALISIEEKLERKRAKKNDPRTCDIDIIDYKKEVMNCKIGNFELTIPIVFIEYMINSNIISIFKKI